MRRLVRENALWAALAAAGCAACAWLSLDGFAWSDYEVEAKPAFDALAHGHLLAFLRLAPAYGGSLVERAPFALAPDLWGGGALSLYRSVAVPGLLATGALAIHIAGRMRGAGASPLAGAVAIAVCTASPLAQAALEEGHAEELLAGGLCVAAVVVAARARSARAALAAGALLGLAIACKQWAVVAAGPALLALGPPATPMRLRRVGLCASGAALAAGVVLAPLLAAGGGFAASTGAVALHAGELFQPWQVWWFFGWHGALRHGAFGVPLPGYRTAPAWAGAISHPAVVLAALALAGALWLNRRKRPLAEREALLALTLVLLARCMLDTWDIGYYMLPCLLALLAWEAVSAPRTAPLWTLVLLVLPWFCLQQLSEHAASPDAQAAAFLAWTVPLSCWLGVRLFSARPAPPLSSELAAADSRARRAGDQLLSVS
ncbi:MAG TPA: hypothetical protein VL979_11460 [Solirubrobacteraceae bacterium]|nr:hypothetical protein [Solirubrobacteraceae bacterium]